MLQKTALDILKLGHTTFLTGAAGSGKSHVLREYMSYLRKHGIKYAVTASTGIASTHIDGMTIHSWSGIGIKHRLSAYDLETLEEKANLYKRWNETHVLIIDEVSMLHASFIDMLDMVAKHMRRNEEPFGGMQVVFTGDFFQLPPVVRSGHEYESDDIFAFTSRAWKEAKPVVCYLTEQFRQGDDALSAILEAIRMGEIEETHIDTLHKAYNKKHTGDHIKLYTHNENVDDINRKAFETLSGEEHVYEMVTKGRGAVLEALKNNCLADEVLSLKVGAKVICIKNDPERRYVNGSMGEVIDFTNDGAPIIHLASGKKVTIEADSWRIEEDGKVKAEISQLPLKLAWAITVHKSQGMTLDRAEIDLSRAFTGGQGYVALSRLRSLDGLSLKGFNAQALQVSEEVREADYLFRTKSEQSGRALDKYDERELKRLHETFLTKSGGSIRELDEEDLSAQAGAEALQDKPKSYLVTKELLEKGKTVKDIAKERELTEDTIIGHIEKLIEIGEKVALDHTLPSKKDVTKIMKAFEEAKTDKLTPVFNHLGGRYTFHELRLIRAWLEKK